MRVSPVCMSQFTFICIDVLDMGLMALLKQGCAKSVLRLCEIISCKYLTFFHAITHAK